MIKLKNRLKKKSKRKKNNELNKEVFGILIIAFGILSLLSMHNDSMGYVGGLIKTKLMELAGFGGFIVPYIILVIGVLFILNRLNLNESKKSISLIFLFISYLIILQTMIITKLNYNIQEITFNGLMEITLQNAQQSMGGGLIGAIFSYIFLKLFGITGSYIIATTLALIMFLLLTNISIIKILKKTTMFIVMMFKNSFYTIKDFVYISSEDVSHDEVKIELSTPIANNENDERFAQKDNDKSYNIEEKIKILDFTKSLDLERESNITKNKDESEKNFNSSIEKIKISPISTLESYQLPYIDLLEKNEKKSCINEKKEILMKAQKLEETLENFGIDAKIIQISKGPAITRYELQPAPGVKVSRIVNLSSDIALSLAASDVRIEAPIPGKSAIGIEVPNKNKATVSFREIIESSEYAKSETKLPFALGKDISGKPIVANIEKMPHLLIAGATGSGKSVCINTLINSILFKARPDEVKLLLIDPKVVELSVYNGAPHLLIPVVTDPKKAAGALNWAVQEMTERYNKFAQIGVRDIFSYNRKTVESENLEKLPQIVVIIDELADLMMVSPSEVEDSICRLAQMARAAGIHLIVATQRPSVDIITGTIKANIPSRIAFAVSSQADSRTILDMGGAEKLLGKGDMLFYPVGASKPMRIQGAYIDEKEVERIVDFLKGQCNNNYKEEIINDIEKEVSLDSENSDSLLPEAIELVVDEGQASISLLQRRLRIGYARAARLIDEMEERGIVGGYEGSKPRKVLVTKEDLNLK